MTWATAITTLEAILDAAGTATNADADFTVMAGEPATPARKTIAWWFDGSGDNPLIGETLTAPTHRFAPIPVIFDTGDS